MKWMISHCKRYCAFLREVVMVVAVLYAGNADAALFKRCVYPGDAIGVGLADAYVGALDQDCATQCQTDCTNTFSLLTAFGESGADLIKACVQSCQNGYDYSDTPRVASTSYPLWKAGSSSQTVASSCQLFPPSGPASTTQLIKTNNGTYVVNYGASGAVSNFYFVVDTGMATDSKHKVHMSIIDSLNNSGYMCGSNSSYLTPATGLGNNLGYWDVRSGSLTSLPNMSSMPAITPQNGDYLAINYVGNFCQAQNCSMTIAPPTSFPGAGASGQYGYDRGLVMKYGSAQYVWPGNSMSINTSCTTDASGNISCPESSGCATSVVDANGNLNCPPSNYLPASTATFGLNGAYSTRNIVVDNQSETYNVVGFSGVLSGFPSTPTPLSFQYNDLYSYTQDPVTYYDDCIRDRNYPNLSKKYNANNFPSYKGGACCCNTRANPCPAGSYINVDRVENPATYTTTNLFLDNTGGIIVKVDWSGCYFDQSNPNNLQYAIMPGAANNPPLASDYNALIWRNVTVDSDMNISGASGELLLRIAPASASSPGAVGGGYNISVKQSPINNTAKITSGLNTVVEAVNSQLFGSNLGSSDIESAMAAAAQSSGTTSSANAASAGVVQRIFTNLTQDSGFISAVRAVLAFYMAYIGLSFMIGTSQINQKEALTILAKFGVVLTLISPGSFNFFNTYIFNTLIQGSAQMMSLLVINYSDYNITNAVTQGGQSVNLFAFLDPILVMLFSNAIWIKIAALFCSGLSGWFMAIYITISVVLFVIFIFRVVMIYLTSLIAMAILTIVAPIFICFTLFKYTQEMFSGWLKLYISFALQPVFVVAMAAIMAKLIVFVLNSTLSFAACHVCLFGFSIGSINVCLFNWYMAISALTAPSPGTIESPIDAIEALMVLYLLVDAANILCSHLSDLASEIATGSAQALNLAKAAVSNPVTEVGGVVGHMTGMKINMDQEERELRRDLSDIGNNLNNTFRGRR